ncbi:hypothetical protein EPH_0004040 [Eimeria praecox]|uniref:Uncharacterized protein n=1 Tax=Eimeria praecox TaxID=51316 RepID=U6G6B0_9EIME|nr:hypothetical protein EPH_0004040 [Eimeria praecox]
MSQVYKRTGYGGTEKILTTETVNRTLRREVPVLEPAKEGTGSDNLQKQANSAPRMPGGCIKQCTCLFYNRQGHVIRAYGCMKKAKEVEKQDFQQYSQEEKTTAETAERPSNVLRALSGTLMRQTEMVATQAVSPRLNPLLIQVCNNVGSCYLYFA